MSYTKIGLTTVAVTQDLLVGMPLVLKKELIRLWNSTLIFFFSVELTFALSLTGLLSHLGSNICKTQDHSHFDTTPLYCIYIYIHMAGQGKKFQGEKSSKGKVFYGQEPPSGESTTTEGGFNNQLLAVGY